MIDLIELRNDIKNGLFKAVIQDNNIILVDIQNLESIKIGDIKIPQWKKDAYNEMFAEGHPHVKPMT